MRSIPCEKPRFSAYVTLYLKRIKNINIGIQWYLKNNEYWVSIFIIFFGTKCGKNNRSISGVFEDWRPIFVKVKNVQLVVHFLLSNIGRKSKKTPCCGGYFFLHESKKNDK